jgi:hypothetical protein
MKQFDRSKSIQQLEGEDWGEPTFHMHLVRECHRLPRVPSRDFTAGLEPVACDFRPGSKGRFNSLN